VSRRTSRLSHTFADHLAGRDRERSSRAIFSFASARSLRSLTDFVFRSARPSAFREAFWSDSAHRRSASRRSGSVLVLADLLGLAPGVCFGDGTFGMPLSLPSPGLTMRSLLVRTDGLNTSITGRATVKTAAIGFGLRGNPGTHGSAFVLSLLGEMLWLSQPTNDTGTPLGQVRSGGCGNLQFRSPR